MPTPLAFAHRRVGRSGVRLLVPIFLLLMATPVPAQVTPDQAADILLDSARRAYNEKNYPFAVARFREFLAKHGNHKNVPSARYGLALALLDGPEGDFQAALEQLQPIAGNKEFADAAFVPYYLGLAHRGLGVKELAQAVAKPPEATQRRAAANQHFEEAARLFSGALPALTAKAPAIAADTTQLPIEWEWVSRARCDLAEMLLRTTKAKEALETAATFLKDPVLVKSRYRPQGLYYHGYASFLLKDYLTAGRSLSLLTPFADPVFGTHARYILARVHHLSDERAEAAAHYEGVLSDHAAQKQAANEALKQPDKFKNDPEEKVRLEVLARETPDHVARATFYLGVLRYEDGQFGEALPRLTAFMQQFPQSPLASEAQLRLGFCHVQLKQFPEALKALPPLAERSPALADQALLWTARAQIGVADPNNTAAYDAALKAAMDTLRRAADKAQQLAANNPEARTRRGEILMELADVQQLARQHREAATTYGQLLAEKALPKLEEELLQRQATALHLAGDFSESDKLCSRFQQTYPKSTLLPAVLFRHAENASFGVLAVEKNTSLPNRPQELARLNDEAIKRYQVVVEKHPEFTYANLARYGLAQALFRKGELEKAKEALEAVPVPDRNGDLAVVPYLLADCLLRLAPARADDALAAGKLEEQLKGAAELLEGFAGSSPKSPQAPDALLKLGLSHQRRAELLAQKEEKARSLTAARATYERLMQQFPKHELLPQAVLERAKCIAQAGDVNGALNELRRFQGDPLKNAPVAPMALLHMATLLRGQNKAAEAADVLGRCRQQHEANLAKDAARAGWVPLLQYHHGVALREAGKRPEARAVLDLVVKNSPNWPEAMEAALRWGQSLKEDGTQKLIAARQKLTTPNLKPEELAAANKLFEEAVKDLRDTVQYLEAQAEQWKQKQPNAEPRARMHYEAAWCCRDLGDMELSGIRSKIQQERWQKLKDEAAKKTPPGRPPVVVPLPEVLLADVPVQPSEQKARAHYQALIKAFPDLPLSADARFELAELFADRNEHDTAIKLLREALDKEPPPELTDKIRLRLGACAFAKGDAKTALAQFTAVAQNPKSPLAGQGFYRVGECLMQAGDHAGAVKHLTVFRDQPPFQNLPGLTDLALLRLGHALAQLKQWDQSRQAHEQVVARFGNSPSVHEARYGIGWAWQNQKQFDQAVSAYSQVVANTATEVGAKAQLQIGLCRLEQKRYPEATSALLVVPYTYDYPELNALALSEAARAFAEQKQNEQAVKLLQRVIKEHPDTKWAEAAKQRIETLTKG